MSTGRCGNCGYAYDVAARREATRQEIARLKSEIEVIKADATRGSAVRSFFIGTRSGTREIWLGTAGIVLAFLSLVAGGGVNSATLGFLAVGAILIVAGKLNRKEVAKRLKPAEQLAERIASLERELAASEIGQ